MQEEQRLASVRVLAVLQNARALILNWSVMEGSADDAGFAKVQKSIQQLESLLLADPQHAQARALRKGLQQIVKDDETRSRIYAINALKSKQEWSKFDVHMQDKVKPLLGRRCFIPSEVVNMPVSAQAEFLNAGKLDKNNLQTVEGCILKSAGGGLVWVYIFAERMPFRFWMADSQRWLSDADKTELGIPITAPVGLSDNLDGVAWPPAAAAASGVPDLNKMYGAGAATSGGNVNGAQPYWATIIGDKPPLIRSECDLKSPEVGRLPLNTRVHVLQEKVLKDGMRRALIRLDGGEKPHGWMTATTKDGTENLKVMSQQAAEEEEAQAWASNLLEDTPKAEAPSAAEAEAPTGAASSTPSSTSKKTPKSKSKKGGEKEEATPSSKGKAAKKPPTAPTPKGKDKSAKANSNKTTPKEKKGTRPITASRSSRVLLKRQCLLRRREPTRPRSLS